MKKYVLAAVALGLVPTAEAAVYGVPTSLGADGAPTGASVNPPGWLVLRGTALDFGTGEGDGVHQIKLFIEVTGTTLDISVFDPGASGARDGPGAATQTSYTLFSPSGATLATLELSNETGVQGGDPAPTTDNRLVRFSRPCGGGGTNSCGFFRLDNDHVNNEPFEGLSPGVYEFRIRTVGGTEANAFGVRIAVDEGPNGQPVGHYNAYTTASSDVFPNMVFPAETSWLIGAVNSGAPPAHASRPTVVFPYASRGCTLQTSGFDMDANNAVGAGSSARLADTQGLVVALASSNNAGHAESGVPLESTVAANLESANYGIFTLAIDLGSSNANGADWRVADFMGWSDNFPMFPRNPLNPIRMYLPNGYSPAAGDPRAVAPVAPVFAMSTRVVSGANPPVVRSPTTYLVTASVSNPTAAPLAGAQIHVGVPAPVTFAGQQHCYVDDNVPEDANCTFSNSGAGTPFWRRARLNTPLAAGSVFTMNFHVTLTPFLAGIQPLTGGPSGGTPPPNFTAWAQYTPAFSSAAFPRLEFLGPACQLAIDVGSGAVPTRATLRGLRVDAAGGLVEFATGGQQRTAAFHLYATDDRVGGGPRRRLTRAAVVARSADALVPVTYRVRTGPIRERYLLLEEIDLDGKRRLVGPFAADDPRLRRAFDAVALRLDRADAPELGDSRRLTPAVVARLARPRGAAPVSAPPAPAAPPLGLKLEVSRKGPVEVPLAELHARGLPPRVKPQQLRLHNLGRRVPFRVEAAAVGPVLAFEGEPLSTDYAGRNAYLLTWGAAPPAPQARLTRSAPPVRAGDLRIERNALYVPSLPQDGDGWCWDLLIADGSGWPTGEEPGLGDFDLPELPPGAAGDVTVRIRLVGRSRHVHSVSAAINGVAVGRLRFEGPISAVLTGRVPAAALRPRGNQLSLEYSAAPESPDEVGLAYLDALDLDLGAAAAPSAAPAPPERVVPYDPRVPAPGADYLIVTHERFGEAAARIAAAKRGAGHRVAVVDVARAYDRFSAGIVEADAVRALIRAMGGGSGLRYVLLLGGDTFDARDYLGTGAVAFIPSLHGWDGGFGRVPSENRYADVDGDGRPDVAIGRLPASTAEEAHALAAKVEAGTAALRGLAGRHLFVVDNQAPGDADFRGEARAAAGALPAGSTVRWADLGDGVEAARAALFAALREGVAAVHYFGHAGPEVWADEAVLTVEDVEALERGSQGGVVFSWACESAWFQNLFGPALNEALVLAPDGGGLASFGPAGITDPALQRALLSRVYRFWIERRLPLGVAVQRAKAEALRASPSLKPVVEGWNLLGDPALPGLPPPP